MKKIFIAMLLFLLSNIAIAIPNLNFEKGTAYWVVAGSNSKNYVLGIERERPYKGKTSAYIKSVRNTKGFGFMMRYTKNISAYRGKRIRMSAYVKSKNVQQFAGLWIAPSGNKDGNNYHESGSLTGTTGWKKSVIILNVPYNATDLRFGVKLQGSGKVWVDDFKFEIIG